MGRAIGAGVHSLAWNRPAGGFAQRAVLFYLWNQLEQGTACPVTMTFASIPIFAHAPRLARTSRSHASIGPASRRKRRNFDKRILTPFEEGPYHAVGLCRLSRVFLAS